MRFTEFVLILGLLLLCAAVAPAVDYTVWPTGEVNSTGCTDYATRQDGAILVYGGADTGAIRKQSGYMKFDLTAIPDDATVDRVDWYFHVYDTYWPMWSVTPLSIDPAGPGAKAELLWEDIMAEATAGYYCFRDEQLTYSPGWKELHLGGTAAADVTAALAQDWIALGAVSRDTNANYFLEIDGRDSVDLPYLVVHDDPVPPPGCQAAIIIPGTPGINVYSGDTSGWDDLYNCSADCVGGGYHTGPDSYYRITLPADSRVCATLDQSVMDWDGGIYLVTDCEDVNGTCVAGASRWWVGWWEDETFCYTAPGDETYYLIVDGQGTYDCGAYQLTVAVNTIDAPSGLTCLQDGFDVSLGWVNNDTYESVEVYLDGALTAVLPGSAESTLISAPDSGYLCSEVCGVSGVETICSDPCCLVHGYDYEELLWDFEADDGGFTPQGNSGWEWGVPLVGDCVGGAVGNVWDTDLDETWIGPCCWLLDSPFIDVGFGLFLSIDHCYDTDPAWGGTVWFTIDGSTFQVLEPLDGYDRPLFHHPSCGWMDRQWGFSGNSGGWVTDFWDLTGTAWHDQQVSLRFAFGSDETLDMAGWLIDNITLYHDTLVQSCDYTVTPTSGTVPFSVVHRITLTNHLSGGPVLTRRIAARIAVTISNGSSFDPWRSGYTNITPGESFTTQFSLNFPTQASVLGDNTFTLSTLDVTPAPYNQPPYPPDGFGFLAIQTVTAHAP